MTRSILGEARSVFGTPYGLLTTTPPAGGAAWLSTVYLIALNALYRILNIPENSPLRESHKPLRLVMSYGCGRQVGMEPLLPASSK